MKYPHYVIAGVLLLFTLSVTAQQNDKIRFSFGDEYELPKKHEDLGFVGNEKDGYVQVGHRVHASVSLQKFSPDYKLESEQIISIKEMPDSYNSEMLRTIGNRHYWFFSTWDRKNDNESLYVQEIDIKSNQFAGGARLLLTSQRITWTPDGLQVHSKDAYKGIHYTFYFPHDASKMLITYRRVPEKTSDKINRDKIGLCVFNTTGDSLKQIWKKEVLMPYTEEKMDNEDYQIDKAGNIYLLAKVYNADKNDKKKNPIYHYELLNWTSENRELVKIPFTLKEKFVRHAFIGDNNGKIVIAGYYSSEKSQNVKELNGLPAVPFFQRVKTASVDGAFVLILDAEKNELKEYNQGFYEFSAEVIKAFESSFRQNSIDRKDKKEDAEIKNLPLKDFLVNDDGSISLFGEEYMVSTYAVGTGNSRTYITRYYCGDVYGMCIDKNGKLKWMVKVPKDQQGTDTESTLSYTPFFYKGNTYLFFMDNPKNMNNEVGKVPETYGAFSKRGILAAVKIDEAGSTSKAELYSVKEDEMYVELTKFQHVGNTGLITRAWHKRKCKIALVSFGN